MPNINQMKDSKYLKKEDCARPLLLTIRAIHEQNVAMDNKPPEMKWLIDFVEHEKPLILNGTNAQLIAAFLGSEETDDWIGKKIVLYADPSIQFQGKLVGGIRCRAPKQQAAPPLAQQQAQRPPNVPPRRPAPPAPPPEPEYDDGQGDAYEGDQNQDIDY